MAVPPEIVLPPAETRIRNNVNYLLTTAKTIAAKPQSQSQVRILGSQLTKFRQAMVELDRATERRLQADTEDQELRARETDEWFTYQLKVEEEYQTYQRYQDISNLECTAFCRH